MLFYENSFEVQYLQHLVRCLVCFLVQLDLLPLAVSPCSTIANLGQRTRASSGKLTHYWQLSPPAASAEVFPGAEEFGSDVYLDFSLSPCGILVEETKKQAAYPLFWQGT